MKRKSHIGKRYKYYLVKFKDYRSDRMFINKVPVLSRLKLMLKDGIMPSCDCIYTYTPGTGWEYNAVGLESRIVNEYSYKFEGYVIREIKKRDLKKVMFMEAL